MTAAPELPVARMTRWLEAAVTGALSPFDLSEQVQDWGGRRWAFAVELDEERGAEARRIGLLFDSLGGKAGRFVLRDASHIPLLGRGVPVVDGNGQTGATLATRGWAVAPEAGRVNLLTNSRLVGGAVGVIGAAGVLPTHWLRTNGAGLTLEVLTIGDEDGLPTMRLRISGAPTETLFLNMNVGAEAQVPGGSQWTGSLIAALSAGNLSNVTALRLRLVELAPGSGATEPNFTPTVTPQAVSVTRSVGAGAVRPLRMQITLTASGPVDFTLRLQAPQLNAGAVRGAFQPVPAVVLPAGEVFSVGAGLDRRLYRARADVTPLPTGEASVPILPPLRAAPADGAALDLSTPGCVVRLEDTVATAIRAGDFHSWPAFELREAL